ncbi:hypothetical protein AIT98_004189 [Salmonella enterica subsp. indica]|uniref:Uncharacterized protein n=1 Tax=Salmonella enterica TaxID=28901 RepID=A0A701ZLC0_SALER|nr:hypothetical protein [Salmonella enterica]HAC6576971.1 hypothetical protein [Salmonella enterica subsp. indica]HBC0062798.1 hypothetical protein [Salmonella enterica]HCL5302939.1 hypothetical protein [Salmonella enterica]
MRITATQIEQWADTRDAQGMLPILIRRLISATTTITALSMPGGDSVSTSGWDGIVQADKGNIWVPVGASFWEMGCSSDIITKARSDFQKRNQQISPQEATKSCFVFVSPRRWPKKDNWLKEARAENIWSNVYALDADDLETWLENTPAVALWFGELTGHTGTGIESISHFWERWRNQSQFPLTKETLLAGREEEKNTLNGFLSEKKEQIIIRADSQEEAIAFVCASLIEMGHENIAACITTDDGWHFIDKNPSIQFCLAMNSDISRQSRHQPEKTIFIPFTLGDHNTTGNKRSDTITLERLTRSDFEEKLIALGEEESDARRLSRTTGRSWSVYRRLRARNPTISSPVWLTTSPAKALITLTLVGCWNGKKEGDKYCVETIAQKDYEELEQELHEISLRDDSPVLQIGDVWKAKSPIELLYQLAPRLTESQLERFFLVVKQTLLKPDPALELKNEDRWIAAIYGKVRSESDFILKSIADSLVKLRIYAESSEGINSDFIIVAIDNLVRELLMDADGERWLSLTDVLCSLAEASPEVFLKSIETSLQSTEASVTRLLMETSESTGFGMRCWHADLLHALEILAWNPRRLLRISLILAKLSSLKIQGNWANTPENTLKSLLRPYWPQTMATDEQRLIVLDMLIKKYDSIVWRFLYEQTDPMGGVYMGNARPKWRDDDAGSAQMRGYFLYEYYSALGERILDLAEKNVERIAALIKRIDHFEGAYQERLIALIKSATSFSDKDKEIVREALCHYLNWHNSYNTDGDKKSRAIAEDLMPFVGLLTPQDIILDKRRLFTSHYPVLPEGSERDHLRHSEKIRKMRINAIEEIYYHQGWHGISSLLSVVQSPSVIGESLATCNLHLLDSLSWIIEKFRSNGFPFHDPLISSFYNWLPEEKRLILINSSIFKNEMDSDEKIAAFHSVLPPTMATWHNLSNYPESAQMLYWKGINYPHIWSDDADEIDYFIGKMTLSDRYVSAFNLVKHRMEKISWQNLLKLLNGFRTTTEKDVSMPDGWHLSKAIEYLESSGQVPRLDLALLEFFFFTAFRSCEKGAKNLYAELLSNSSLFMQLICLAYKPESEKEYKQDESLMAAAQQAGRVLDQGKGIPGQKSDHSIDEDVFSNWIKEVRKLATENDRSNTTDYIIGEWLSRSKHLNDAPWSSMIIKELLEETERDEIRQGFYFGTINSRGTTVRAYYEGGDKERKLVDQYKEIANQLYFTHPKLASVFDDLASHYDFDAANNDRHAKLRLEGY